MKILIAFALLIASASCNSKTQKQSQIANKNGLVSQQYQNDIVGVWGVREEENALFQITEDSIYYFDHFSSPVSYEIKEMKLWINYSGEILSNEIVKLDSDSLHFISPTGDLLKLYKRK